MSSTGATGKTRKRATIEELLDELRSVVGEAEDLLRTAEDDADGPLDQIRARVDEKLGRVKERLSEAEGLGERARTTGKAADAYVRKNPWTAVAIAVGLGYLVGRIGRRN